MSFLPRVLSALNEEGSPFVHILGTISYPIQLVISLFLIDCYIFNKEFQLKPGSIILFYAISALGTSIIGGLEHIPGLGDLCYPGVGFFALFFEYNCLYYEIGFIFFFIHDFAELLNEKIESLSRNASFVPSRTGSLLGNENLPLDRDFERQGQEEKKFDNLEKICKQLQSQEAQARRNQKLFQQRFNEVKQLRQDKRRVNAEFSRAFLQTKINVTVIVMSLSSALVPYLCHDLGPNPFGGCSDAFKPEKQEIRMGFYLILAATNAIVSALGFLSFVHQRRKLKENTLESLKNSPDMQEAVEKTEHYSRHVFIFIFVTTFCCWIFSALNIYAALTVPDSDNSQDFQAMKDSKWDLLLFIHVIQGAVALFFKLGEPMVWHAVKATYKNRWKKLERGFNRVRYSNCLRRGNPELQEGLVN